MRRGTQARGTAILNGSDRRPNDKQRRGEEKKCKVEAQEQRGEG